MSLSCSEDAASRAGVAMDRSGRMRTGSTARMVRKMAAASLASSQEKCCWRKVVASCASCCAVSCSSGSSVELGILLVLLLVLPAASRACWTRSTTPGIMKPTAATAHSATTSHFVFGSMFVLEAVLPGRKRLEQAAGALENHMREVTRRGYSRGLPDGCESVLAARRHSMQ